MPSCNWGRPGRVASRLYASVLALALALTAGPCSRTAEAQFNTSARQAILMDAETGSVLYQKNADELMAPASMSKLMTLAVVFRALKAGEKQLNEQLVVSDRAWRVGGGRSGGSSMLLAPRTRITIHDLIQGVIVQSGNDASIVLAEGMSGSEPEFAKKMTEEARRLGMQKATFVNATGLPDSEHKMTARELGLLALHLIKDHADYYPWFAQKELRHGKHRFTNRNPLLFVQGLGVDGLKTGQTSEAGYGMVASAVRESQRLIAVVNGLDSKEQRKNEATKLLDWGYKSFAAVKLYDATDIVGEARVWGGSRFFVPLQGAGDVTVLMPRFLPRNKFEAQVVYRGPLKPPIKRGDQVAVLRVTTPAGTVSEAPLHAAEDVDKASVWARGLDALVHLAFRWVPL